MDSYSKYFSDHITTIGSVCSILAFLVMIVSTLRSRSVLGKIANLNDHNSTASLHRLLLSTRFSFFNKWSQEKIDDFSKEFDRAVDVIEMGSFSNWTKILKLLLDTAVPIRSSLWENSKLTRASWVQKKREISGKLLIKIVRYLDKRDVDSKVAADFIELLQKRSEEAASSNDLKTFIATVKLITNFCEIYEGTQGKVLERILVLHKNTISLLCENSAKFSEDELLKDAWNSCCHGMVHPALVGLCGESSVLIDAIKCVLEEFVLNKDVTHSAGQIKFLLTTAKAQDAVNRLDRSEMNELIRFMKEDIANGLTKLTENAAGDEKLEDVISFCQNECKGITKIFQNELDRGRRIENERIENEIELPIEISSDKKKWLTAQIKTLSQTKASYIVLEIGNDSDQVNHKRGDIWYIKGVPDNEQPVRVNEIRQKGNTIVFQIPDERNRQLLQQYWTNRQT